MIAPAAAAAAHPQPVNAARTSVWPVVAVSAAGSAILGGLAIATPWRGWYPWTLTVLLAAAAIALAVIDQRTHTLPNRWTAPLAAAGIIQAATIAIIDTDPWRLVWAIAAAAVVFITYTLMGMAGWFGFGDAKAAAALTITIAIPTGLLAIYLVPAAVLLGGIWRATILAITGNKNPHPHGPALAIAAIALMTAGVLTTGTGIYS